MNSKTYTDEQIVKGLTGNPRERDLALKALFQNQKLKAYIIGFVRKNRGNTQDGEDVFQDAIILLDRRVRQGGYKGTGSIDGYLQGIAKFIWYRKRDKWQNKTEALTIEHIQEEVEQGIETSIIAEEKKQAIKSILQHLGDKCKKILTMYQNKFSMEEIAEKMDFSGKDVAKNEAYRCRQKFRKFVVSRADYKRLLDL